ncbi:MAG: hypothetical protein R3F14_07075 [Polyangiaceae bacterium]
MDAQRIDVLFYPRPLNTSHLPELGLLGRMAATPCLFEVFRDPPYTEQRRDAIRKLLSWHHLELLREGRHARASSRRRHESPSPLVATGAPAMPVLWILSAGRPDGAVEGLVLQRLEGWPEGVYASPQGEVPVRLVILSELPPTRETLPLRLMARGATFARAVQDLADLPADAWERRLLAPIMLSLQAKIANAQPIRPLSEEEKELLVNGLKMIEAIEAKGWKRGIRQGRKEGRAAGVREGLEPVLHQFARRLGAPLTPEQTDTILHRMTTLGPDRLGDVVLDLDATALAAWLADTEAR